MRLSYYLLPFVHGLLIPISYTYAALTNRTIDDTDGDSVTGSHPIYLPQVNWEAATNQPNFFNRTYTGAWYYPDFTDIEVSFSFTGVAVYVYIVTNKKLSAVCNFTLDDEPPVLFSVVREYRGFGELEPNITGFSRSGLANTLHNLTIVTSDLNVISWFGLDYVVYTTDDTGGAVKPSITSSLSITGVPLQTTTPSPSPAESHSKSISSGAIAGAVVGALALVVGALFVFLVCRRHQQRTLKAGQLKVEAFTASTPTVRAAPTFKSDDFVRQEPISPSGTIPSSKARMMMEDNAGDRIITPPTSAVSASTSVDTRRVSLTAQNLRLHAVQQELAELTAALADEPNVVDVGTLTQQIQRQQSQIDLLHSQLRASALGPLDASPPVY